MIVTKKPKTQPLIFAVVRGVQVGRRSDDITHPTFELPENLASLAYIHLFDVANSLRGWYLEAVGGYPLQDLEDIALWRLVSIALPPSDGVIGLRADDTGHTVTEVTG